MNELVIVGEGETEQTFVRDQLAEHLILQGTSAWAVLPGRRRNRAGVKKWEVARQDIVRALKENRYCSTMFDCYALPKDWPGRTDSANLAWNQRARHVEDAFAKSIQSAMGGRFDPKFFIPYVQLHEFEALTFADIEELASVTEAISPHSAAAIVGKLAQIVKQAGHPEAINDGYETCPSRRIAGIVPAYKKRVHGPIVTRRIGLRRCAKIAITLRRGSSVWSRLELSDDPLGSRLIL